MSTICSLDSPLQNGQSRIFIKTPFRPHIHQQFRTIPILSVFSPRPFKFLFKFCQKFSVSQRHKLFLQFLEFSSRKENSNMTGKTPLARLKSSCFFKRKFGGKFAWFPEEIRNDAAYIGRSQGCPRQSPPTVHYPGRDKTFPWKQAPETP